MAWLVCLAGLAVLVAPASAQAPGASDPAVDQYVESVPTTRGTSADPASPGSGPAAKLSPAAKRHLDERAGADAGVLEAIATSPDLGAPAKGKAERRSGDGDAAGGMSSMATSEPALPTAVSNAAAAGGSAVLALVGGLAAATLLLVAVMWRRRRAAGRS